MLILYIRGIPHPIQGDQKHQLNQGVELFDDQLREALSSTMIYTHVAGKNLLGVKSPLDQIGD
jgi:hypothetical protein